MNAGLPLNAALPLTVGCASSKAVAHGPRAGAACVCELCCLHLYVGHVHIHVPVLEGSSDGVARGGPQLLLCGCVVWACCVGVRCGCVVWVPRQRVRTEEEGHGKRPVSHSESTCLLLKHHCPASRPMPPKSVEACQGAAAPTQLCSPGRQQSTTRCPLFSYAVPAPCLPVSVR